jgi:hypothetical protein
MADMSSETLPPGYPHSLTDEQLSNVLENLMGLATVTSGADARHFPRMRQKTQETAVSVTASS